MSHVNSSYGRLASAWAPGLFRSRAAPLAPAPLGTAVSAAEWPESLPVNTATVPWVLVARLGARAPATFDCGMMVSACDQDRVYRIDPVVVSNLDELLRRCGAHAPRVLVIDGALTVEAGAGALQHLRRRLPATDVLVAWDCPPRNAFELAVRVQARGSVDWSLTADQLTRALDAVMAGEVWFPRPVLQSLYLALMDAQRAPSAPANCPAEAIAGALTEREVEVFTLMRRGMTNKQMAERLDISVNTIKKHLASVFEKRGLHGRRQERD
jgi:DNA-binding NarL/FixJ family response regulator